ncbi:MAG: DUF2497 domain-containing protein [Acetobacteraceae bacterium]|nr:DUF2497 domain-containing protein [Acetobacteraceae bacterium]
MDDILASIRRILNEDDKTAKAPADGVLMLDPSMMVDDAAQAGEPDKQDSQLEIEALSMPASPDPVHNGPGADDLPHHAPAEAVPEMMPKAAAPSLVAPEAAAAAASSVGALVRKLAAERSAAVSRGGITLEEIVREEMRPVLKAWLDTNLPPLVERLVQAEIERVVGRNAG